MATLVQGNHPVTASSVASWKQHTTHPVGEFGAAVVALRQIEDGVVVSMATVEEWANILYVVLVANLHWLRWVGHHWTKEKRYSAAAHVHIHNVT